MLLRERDRREPMNPIAATNFRRPVVRLTCLSLDRPDIAVATNHLARMMAQPRCGEEILLKRVGRYLRGRPVCRQLFRVPGSVLDDHGVQRLRLGGV